MSSEVSNNNIFTHSGVISKITGNSVIVSLEQNIQCDSCRAKAACGISESKTKNVEIINSNTSFKINEQVKVVLKRSLGFKAVFWAYIFPFILMFSTLIITSGFLKEWIAGTLSLLILLPYYILLYFFKSTLRSVFNMSILKS